MKQFDPKKIAHSWALMHKAEEGSSTYIENFWAFDALSDLCSNSPNECLHVIEEIFAIESSSNLIIANLAAGPLEDLLVQHGDLMIEKIVNIAESNPLWRKMLGAVWQNDIKDHVWSRLKSVTGSSW